MALVNGAPKSSSDQMIKKYRHKLAMRGIEIPEWVPKRLIVEFADCALEHGEERAASHVRKVKKELRL